MISLDELLVVISESFQVPISSVSIRTSKENTENWDSLNHLVLFLKIEDRFKIKFSIEEIQQIDTVEKLFNLINEK
jgi:acyl carrier protein